MTADPCPDENALGMLAEGAIADADRTAVERHLDSCPYCTRLVCELGRLAGTSRRSGRFRRCT
ncbi:MAG: zf-HC2 domain-containing protein [Kofleriaceae bacterium]